MNMSTFMFLSFMQVLLGFIGYMIGKSKGRGELGLILGVFLGLFGIFIIACIGRSNNNYYKLDYYKSDYYIPNKNDIKIKKNFSAPKRKPIRYRRK